MSVRMVDHSREVLEAFRGAAVRALEKCGLDAEGFAKIKAPVDQGTLRNSITHRVDESELAVYVGTNIEYAPYVELGTGKYYLGGRPDPWVYQDAEGKWHYTAGQRAQPYLKPAVADHKQHYRDIIDNEMRNG